MRKMLVFAVACVALAALADSAAEQGKKLVLAVPGTPPIFAAVLPYVAEKEGFFKKHGVDVELRPFDTGTAASRAVIAGDVELSMSPSPLVIDQISNANANVVGIYGYSNPDWILASTDPSKTNCKDIVGQPVGVDGAGGVRSTALRSMLAGGCSGVKVEDVQQVALSSNTAPAMAAGRLSFGVLHLDDVAVLEIQGKKVNILLEMKKTNPTSHYLLITARRDKLKENRDSYVRAIAALVEAARFLNDRKNADRVAGAAAPTGHNAQIAKAALKKFNDMGFWPVEDDGMDQTKLEAVTQLMVRTGGITTGKQPVKYERLVDKSIWQDAAQLLKK